MRRRTLVFAAAGAALLALLAYLVWPSGSSGSDGGDEGAEEAARTARQRAARRDGTADRRPATASGRVTDDRGQPIAGAIVSIAMRNLSRGERSEAGEAPEPLTALTDAAGRWRAAGLPPGRYTVSAAARGHLPATIDPLVLGPAEERSGIDFTLRRGGHTLSGTVSDIGGGPIAGALVRATSITEGNVFHLFRAPFTSMTGPDGRYELTLADGTYMVEAIHLDYVGDERWTQIAGGDRTEDFTLTPGAAVHGEVRWRDSGEPIAGATVTRVPGGGGGRFDLGSLGLSGSVTDSQGRFVLRGLPSGTALLTAFGPGYAAREPTEVELGIGEQVTGVVILVDRAYSISGFVVEKENHDRGIDGVLVAAYDFNGHVHLARDSSAEDGFFEIHGVQPGSYMVGAAGEERVVALMAQSVTVKDADVTDVIIPLDAGATLSGRVEPPVAARIGLDVDPESIGFGTIASAVGAVAASCRTAPDGTFALRGVPPGKFTLVAHGDDGSEGRLEVVVSDADQSNLVVRLEERAYVAGVVVDPDGRPVEGLQVEARAPGRPGGILTAMSQLWGRGRGVTGKDGQFRIAGLVSGTYRLTVEDRGGRRLRASEGGARRVAAGGEEKGGPGIEVTIEEMRPVTGLRLVVEARTGVIRGLVVGPDGQPVPDAWVTARARDFELPFRRRGGGDGGGAREGQRDGEASEGKKTRTVTITVGSGGSRVESSSEGGEDEGGEEESRRRRMRRWMPAESPVLTGPEGRFEIRNLREVAYDLEVEGLKGSARGLVEEVRPGADVTVRLQPLAGITGRVTRAGQPVTSYMVQVEGPMSRRTSVLDPEGKYRIGRLDPGTYTVSITAPEGRASAKVKVAPSQVARRDLSLIPYGSVTGVVIDATTGEPMAGLPVIAFSEEGNDAGAMAMDVLSGDGPRTDTEGRFRVGRLGTGEGAVLVFDGDKTAFNVVARKEFTLAPGQNLDLGTLSGHNRAAVPKEERGELGMEVVAATWSARPRAPGSEEGEDGDPPDGIDPSAEHLWVSAVEEGGPAAAAGVEVGDRIDAVSGMPVSQIGADMARSLLAPRHIQIGQPVALVIERDGKRDSVSITPRPAGGAAP